MARYTGPVCRLCRREGEKLFLKGAKCNTAKCPVDRRGYPPGQHGQGRRPRRASEYGTQLREKQKLRRIYGVLEGQFESYYQKATKSKGVTGEALLVLLETRLDNIAYRLGFASSRPAARQLVMHGHIEVNGQKVDIPSAQVREGDVISVREKSRGLGVIKESVAGASSRVPSWLEVDEEALTGKLDRLPTREEIDVRVEEHLIVEFYSR